MTEAGAPTTFDADFRAHLASILAGSASGCCSASRTGCAFAAAALLTLADIGVRLIPSTNELKLGVVTAFLGVPVFLVHLMRERRI